MADSRRRLTTACSACGAPLQTRTVAALGVERVFTLLCPCGSDRRESERRRANLEVLGESVWACSDVPLRFREAQVDASLPPVVRRALRTAVARLPDLRDRTDEPNLRTGLGRVRPVGRGLGLWGPVGSGKTHALAALLRAARERLVAGILLPATALQLELESAQRYASRRTPETVIERYVQTPILVLDDVDKLLPTSPSVALAIYELLDARWRDGRPLCLTCNVDPAHLAQIVFERFEAHAVAIGDRWLDMTEWVAYPGASRRGGAALTGGR